MQTRKNGNNNEAKNGTKEPKREEEEANWSTTNLPETKTRKPMIRWRTNAEGEGGGEEGGEG